MPDENRPVFCVVFLLLLLTAGVASLICPWPCDVARDCSQPQPPSFCEHGTVPDFCHCCQVCGLGEGAWCGASWGRCGDGLECNMDAYPAGTITDSLPGECKVAAPTTVPATEGTTTSAAAPATMTEQPAVTATTTDEMTVACAQLGYVSVEHAFKTLPPPETSSATESAPKDEDEDAEGETQCRQPCSVEFCSDVSKHRICSAKGMEVSHVAARGTCQHTSCRACFLLVQPAVCMNQTCSEPAQKQCLRPYYQCIRSHLQTLALDNPAAKNHQGKILCYVNEVPTST